jgi:hypothetical protein
MNSEFVPLIQEKLSTALGCQSAFVKAETAGAAALLAIYRAAWNLGRALTDLKDEVPHGQWEDYVSANFKELGPTDKTRNNKARAARALYIANPNPRAHGDLEEESIRKFHLQMWGEKDRSVIPGNRTISSGPHYLTFVNQYTKWSQQISSGAAEKPPVDAFRRDMEPIIKDIAMYGGADWIQSLL